MLRTTLLLREFMCVKAEIQEELRGQQNITENLDSWTDNRGHSVYTSNIVFPDRQIAQWACEDVSPESHTGEFLRGSGQRLGKSKPCYTYLQTIVATNSLMVVCT